MIGWFSSFFFCFVFFLPSPNTVPWEQQWLTCKVFVSEWKMQTSTTETRAHCQQRLAALPQQWQANTLAQLGSNPLKPLLSATADPTTPSGVQKNGSIFERKTSTFYFAAPKYKEQGHGDGGFPAHRELLVRSLSALPFTQSLRAGCGFKVHNQLFWE